MLWMKWAANWSSRYPSGLLHMPWSAASRPAGLRDGVLVVEVEDGTAASLLKYQEQALLERLEQGLGSRFVQQVRIRLSTRKNAP